MSFEIVKGISIKKGKVFTRMCSNNVYPYEFKSEENKYLTQVLKENGLISLYKLLVEGGLEGNLHFRRSSGSRIVKHLDYAVKSLEKDKEYISLRKKVSELENKLWGFKEDCKEKEQLNKEIDSFRDRLNKFIDFKVRELFDSKIKVPSSIKKELENVLEMYEENLENDEGDVFSSSKSSYANEMLSQNIFDVLSKENVEKIMALNNNLYIVLDLSYANKTYDEVLNEITDKLIEKFEYYIESLEDFINVVKEENEMEERNEYSIS